MLHPFLTLVLAEGLLILILLSKTPLRYALIKMLDRVKKGRGSLVFHTVGATVFTILISNLYNVTKIRKRLAGRSGPVSPTDEVLLVTHLLDACLLGFSLFLGFMINRIHCFIKEIRELRKSLDATKKLNH